MSTLSSGSTKLSPELDWCQLKETVVMLNLAVAQIDQSMNEGNSSVETLSGSFTSLASNLSDIQSSVSQASDEEDLDTIKILIQGSATTALDKVHSAIMAFQFYDKLTQRLDHVSQSLTALTALIDNPDALYSPVEWRSLHESIRGKYTMEEERNMFDKVIAGMPIDEALAEFKQELLLKESSEDDEVELF